MRRHDVRVVNTTPPGLPEVWIDGEQWPVTLVDTRTRQGHATTVRLEFIPGSLTIEASFPDHFSPKPETPAPNNA